jgi:hypothetical protein
MESYLQTLEKLCKKERLYINDLIYQSTIFLLFTNKTFKDLSDLKGKQRFAKWFLEQYNKRIERFKAVTDIIQKRKEDKSIQGVNIEAYTKLKDIHDKQFNDLENNLRIYSVEATGDSRSLTRIFREFC